MNQDEQQPGGLAGQLGLAEQLGQALAEIEQGLASRGAEQPSGDPQMPLQQTLERLANEDDPKVRQQLAALLGQQIVRADGRSIDQMQSALWQQQLDIRGWVGDTNSMIADIVQNVRQVAAAVQRIEAEQRIAAELRIAAEQRIEAEQRTQGDTQGLMAGHLSALTERIDRQLDNHEQRIARNEQLIGDHEQRLGNHEQRLATLERSIRQSHGPAQI